MSYKELERRRLIESVETSAGEILSLFTIVERDINIAQHLVSHDLDWAFNLAYNSMLQSCLALMQAYGYRARGPSKHKTALLFARSVLSEEYDVRLRQLDRIRRKRHRAVCEVAGLISKREAEETIRLAVEFSAEVKTIVNSRLGDLE
jgi:uncharacterized protein (UPF0332 family)